MMTKPYLPPLHEAAMDGDIAEINRLIDDGLDVNEKGNYGVTPLHSAAYWGKTETALSLVNAGGECQCKN